MMGGGRAAQQDLERDTKRHDGQCEDDNQKVFEQHAEGEQHHAERRQRVQSGERRREERADGARDHGRPKRDVAGAMSEQEAQTRPREALDPADDSRCGP